jgi:hypothetical protein
MNKTNHTFRFNWPAGSMRLEVVCTNGKYIFSRMNGKVKEWVVCEAPDERGVFDGNKAFSRFRKRDAMAIAMGSES